MNKQNHILSIAGFDPSGGAGILADVKTFEQHKCIGLAVQTANTIQTEDEFIDVNWINEEIVLKQLTAILNGYSFNHVKIGLVPSLVFLNQVIGLILSFNPKTKIIWDPVLSASSGFDFKQDLSDLSEVLKKIYLITPNWNEVKKLSGETDARVSAEKLAKMTKVYLKGGHNETDLGKDFLFDLENKQSFNPKNRNKTYYPKHGSGCILSSAIAANLQQGYPLQKSCLKSKRYIEGVLSSSKTLLGRHKL